MSYLSQVVRGRKGPRVKGKSLFTPVSQKISPNQVLNRAGGFVYEVSNWKQLDRFLILGTEGGTYYASEEEMTLENARNAHTCVLEDGVRVVRRIEEISTEGRALKQGPGIFVLAMVAGLGDVNARSLAMEKLAKICRTGGTLLQFVSYVDQFRGWGRALVNGVANWYLSKNANDVAFQVTKYAQREGWSQRDVLRLSHPKSQDAALNNVFKYVVSGGLESNEGDPTPDLLKALCEIKAEPEKIRLDLIEKYNLAREVLPTEWLTKPEVWEAMLPKMPLTAMIRNLATMTRVGLITENSEATKMIVEKLVNQEYLTKSRIHPMQVFTAMLTYSQGRGQRGTNTWIPSNTIVGALDRAYYMTYGNVAPTGKKLLIALDLSGSMTMDYGTEVSSPRQLATAMAMVQVNTEPNVEVIGFSDTLSKIRSIPLCQGQSLEKVNEYISYLPSGGTDCSLPMTWAAKNGRAYEGIVIYTDNETWRGRHPSQMVRQYRAFAPGCKIANVGVTATRNSLVDDKDQESMDFVGFDANLPQALNEFLVS